MLVQDNMLKWYQQVVILLITCCSIKLEAATVGLLPEGVQCACAGDRLFYNCSVVGGTATRWKGSLLDCPLNEITLRHSQFGSNQAIETCNNGDISGYGIESGAVNNNNNCYISQLNVTVRASFNNKTVQCILNSNEGTTIIGESVLSVLSVTNFYPPPENLSLADAQEGKLTFKWSSVRSNSYCNIPQYGIISDCGICPTITNMTIATCSDLQLSTNAVTCHFQVSTHACNLTGNPSLAITVTLKVPDVPQVKIVPSYSNDSQVLQKIFIVTTLNQTEDLFYISGGIIGSPVNYLVSGTSFNSTVDLSTCDSSGCPVKVPFCSQSTIINVTISAANKLGEGPPSNPFMTECTNNFVQVLYIETSSESTISCIFLNSSDTSGKTCCITYQPCDHEGTNAHECSDSFPYEIELEASDGSSQRYCYTVTVRNATHTVKVEGNFTLGHNRDSTAIIAAAVIVPFICILLLLGIMIGIALLFRTRSKQKPQYKYDYAYDSSPLAMEQYHLPSTITLHKVRRNCKLQEYITNVVSVEFRRGHTYYEFVNEKENILEGKEVLLQDKKNTKKWFKLTPPENVAAGRLKLYGEGIPCSTFGDQYRVFIQSFGSGTRHLPRDSWILYNHCEDQVEPDVLPLVPVYSEYFCHKIIDSEEGCTVQQFCTQNGLRPNTFNTFLTVEHLPEEMRDQPPCDVILMNRNSRKLFTGPFARQILDPRTGGALKQGNEKWKVFVLLEKNKRGLVLQKNTEVLYQDSRYMNGKYMVVEVDEDCVRMSKFIETKLGGQYEDGRAFYEAGKEEDLLYCKKILRPQKEQLSRKQLELQPLIEYFYAIDGVPAKGVKLDGLRHVKIFIQSTSQGSRCLKIGEKILYLEKYASSNDHKPHVDPDETNYARPGLTISADDHR